VLLTKVKEIGWKLILFIQAKNRNWNKLPFEIRRGDSILEFALKKDLTLKMTLCRGHFAFLSSMISLKTHMNKIRLHIHPTKYH
jgi:hypothetical protein